MEYHQDYVCYLVSKGGPDPTDYTDLDAWISEVANQSRSGILNAEDKENLVACFGEAFSAETMQGFAYRKPHGYAGDFEIIDRIYSRYESADDNLRKWDTYWQNHGAANAVRNRNDYFASLVERLATRGRALKILNVASGPGRDVFRFFESHPNLDVRIDCVEQDLKAIDYAKKVCEEHSDRVRFIQQNAIKIETDENYDLVWSAGLFDYFSDRIFRRVLRKLLSFVRSGNGEVVIGNFSPANPSREYMDLFEWKLEYRGPQRLRYLASCCGIDDNMISIEREPECVNLFLHARP